MQIPQKKEEESANHNNVLCKSFNRCIFLQIAAENNRTNKTVKEPLSNLRGL